MKKSLIALAALAATSAFAQSSVTLYGIVEAGVDIGYNARTQTTTIYRDSSGNDISGRISPSLGDTAIVNNTANGGAPTNLSPFTRGILAVPNSFGVGPFVPTTAATAVPGANGAFAPVFSANTRSEYKPSFRVQDGNSQGTGSSRVGFRGTEDLGGGLKANFVLEMGIRVDDGCATSINPAAASAGAQSGASVTAVCQCKTDATRSKSPG